MFNKALSGMTSRPELLILLLMVMIIAMLIIPLPTYLVDFLIGLNIVISVLVFMGAFYIERILHFSSFPSILLITTLFRLALSISTSRLILLDADAGEIVSTFGEFVIGDSLAVGFVIFAIVTVVQFIVITKGSERVAEVAARFSLDAMPGKQMSIDSDLKAGVIDAAGVKERRSVLERESQLYGAFDGSMKFIKGDAIAGIIIIFVNFIGGIAVGMSTHGMDMSTALSTYTILTIGDGLVAQIPALLIAISAGFIVTRVNDDGNNNLGKTIMMQLLGTPFVLIITAILAVGIGMLPGFPMGVFSILGGALAGLYFYRRYAAKKASADLPTAQTGKAKTNQTDSELGLIGNLEQIAPETIPLIVLVPAARFARMKELQLGKRFSSQFFIDFGGQLPEILLRADDALADNRAVVMINEIRVEEFAVHYDQLRVVNATDEIAQLGIAHFVDTSGPAPSTWVMPEFKETLQKLAFQLRPALDEFYQGFAVLLTRNVNEYFGIQETKQMLDKLETKYPDLLKEVYRHATVQRIAEVLQRLLSERISIRNMKLVIETLAHWAPREKDVIALVEHVRGALARYICDKFSTRGELRALVMSPELEDIIRKGVRSTSNGNFLNLDPEQSESLLDKFALALSGIRLSQKDMVVLTAVDVRRFVKRLIESRFRELEVLSFGEITDNVSINVIKSIH
ncbi:EscV/YscV/HrcV family type III secretion system export apparatus protein [Glaciimonas sp. PCH181]|uniref:EscV/YscV/HrcV family type III secretion system export apparatus protein n=1 Tax=Glaciimonas sp. PCH181 TaxID=2133943 RepID=UPI000D34CCD0|nr:EscV/YscV/HrcV family type III secretion system export apparatus protein [Glaciimonas sp. PCH181]PUA19954.1 EscV/YscV/HrcV family type III secretion system export apparatus protein [Glaciimonas sp. PCH181]